MANTPEPLQISVGETIKWIRRAVAANSINDDGVMEIVDIKASEGWTLTLKATDSSGAHTFTVTAVADSDNADDFSFTITAAISAAYTAGDYLWKLTATKATTTYLIARGYVEVIGDTLAELQHIRITLDAIRLVIQGTASREQKSYQISGRSLEVRSVQELLLLETEFQGRYNAALSKVKIGQKRGSGNKILTRFI